MSALSDAMKAIREVLLLQSRVDGLDKRIATVADDMDGLADLVASLRDRVSRLEGIIEGAAMAASRKPRLPKD